MRADKTTWPDAALGAKRSFPRGERGLRAMGKHALHCSERAASHRRERTKDDKELVAVSAIGAHWSTESMRPPSQFKRLRKRSRSEARQLVC